jgi:hypothetical protein
MSRPSTNGNGVEVRYAPERTKVSTGFTATASTRTSTSVGPGTGPGQLTVDDDVRRPQLGDVGRMHSVQRTAGPARYRRVEAGGHNWSSLSCVVARVSKIASCPWRRFTFAV